MRPTANEKIDQPSVRLPFVNNAHDSAIIERSAQVHPSRQIVAGSDVIAWKNIDTAHATEKDIFGGPSS
jgi:hypothetical protein